MRRPTAGCERNNRRAHHIGYHGYTKRRGRCSGRNRRRGRRHHRGSLHQRHNQHHRRPLNRPRAVPLRQRRNAIRWRIAGHRHSERRHPAALGRHIFPMRCNDGRWGIGRRRCSRGYAPPERKRPGRDHLGRPNHRGKKRPAHSSVSRPWHPSREQRRSRIRSRRCQSGCNHRPDRCAALRDRHQRKRR
jgi:hypothetical protein